MGNKPHERVSEIPENWETGSERELKIFSLTILSEAKRPQTQCLSPEGEF